jgi:hypothetical protein
LRSSSAAERASRRSGRTTATMIWKNAINFLIELAYPKAGNAHPRTNRVRPITEAKERATTAKNQFVLIRISLTNLVNH